MLNRYRSAYITVHMDLSVIETIRVPRHCDHENGQTSWALEGEHDPIYFTGRLSDLRRFRDALNDAIDVEEHRPRAVSEAQSER